MTVTLSWDAVPNATSYLLRVDDWDNSVDRIQANGYSPDTCSGLSHDVCVTTTATTQTIYIQNPANMGTTRWWVHAVSNTGTSASAEENLLSCVPNCKNLSAPATVEQGQVANVTATYESAYGQLGSTISVLGTGANSGYSSSLQWPAKSYPAITTSATETFSWDTTTVSPGVYTLYCRAWNDGIAECRGANVDGPPRYACLGPTTTQSITVTPKQLSITGKIWIGQASGASCTTVDPSSTEWSGVNSMQLSLNPAYQGTTPVAVGTDGSYSITGVQQQTPVGTTSNLTLGGTLPAGYQYQCPSSGTRAIDVSGSNQTNVNFFIYDIKNPWWQATGNVFSQNALYVSIPYDTCTTPSCDRYAIAKELFKPSYLRTATRKSLSAGVVVTPSNVSGTTSYLTDRTTASSKASGTGSPTVAENYDYFYNLANPATNGYTFQSNPSFTALTRLSDLQGDTPQNGTEIYYSNASLAVTPTETLAITGNRKIIVLVNGYLTINPGTAPGGIITTVAEGSNLIFIAKNGITISSGVGHSSPQSTQPNLEGVFITSGQLTILPDITQEKKFVGAGSFVGLAGVSLDRNFNSTDLTYNKTAPTELFIFRPDLVANWPNILKTTTLNWKEVQ